MLVEVIFMFVFRIRSIEQYYVYYLKEFSGFKWISRKGDHIDLSLLFVTPLHILPSFTSFNGSNSQSTWPLSVYE